MQKVLRQAPTRGRDPLAALTDRERWVLSERAEGRSLTDIGNDLGLTRERVRQIEAEAMRRVGAPAGRSLADAHEVEREERREFYRERGRRVRAGELRADPATPPAPQSCRPSRRERLAMAAHEAAVAGFLLAACAG